MELQTSGQALLPSLSTVTLSPVDTPGPPYLCRAFAQDLSFLRSLPSPGERQGKVEDVGEEREEREEEDFIPSVCAAHSLYSELHTLFEWAVGV